MRPLLMALTVAALSCLGVACGSDTGGGGGSKSSAQDGGVGGGDPTTGGW